MRDYQVRDVEKTATGDGVPCANLINNEYTLWDRVKVVQLDALSEE